MPFKMVANRQLYRPDEARECKKGEVFTVETETERNRLLRSRRASLYEAKTPSINTMKPPRTETRPAPVIAKVMKAEDPAPAATPPPPSQAPAAPPAAPDQSAPADENNPTPPPNSTTSRSNRYRRNDLRSEE